MSEDLRKLDISVTVAGETRHPTSITLQASVNSYPVVKVTHHENTLAENNSIKVTSQDIAKAIGQRQNMMFQERSSPDMIVSVSSNGGSVNFSGLMNNPMFGFSPYGVEQSDSAIPEYAKMDALDMSIYSMPSPDNALEFAEEIGLTTSGTVCQLISDIVSAMMSDFDPVGEVEDDESVTEYKNAQHTLNQSVVTYLNQILSNSKTSFGWDDLSSVLGNTGGSGVLSDSLLVQRITSDLTVTSGSFLTSLMKLTSTFQCFYIPEFDGPGKFVNWYNIYDSPESKKLDILDINMSVGNRSLFPAKHVTVIASTKGVAGKNPSEYTPQVSYITYPEKPSEGSMAIRQFGPPWLPSIMYDTDSIPGEDDQEDDFDLDKDDEAIEAQKENAKTNNKNTTDVLKMWARGTYLNQALGNSTCSITTPLQLDMKLGTRYKIQNANGESLLEGFLTQLSHNIHMAHPHPNATTSLTFTFVEMEGFSLPYKSE